MAELLVEVQAFGEGPTFVDASIDGHRFANNGRTLFYLRNTSGVDVQLQTLEQRVCEFGHPLNAHPITELAPTGEETRFWHTGAYIYRWTDDDRYAHNRILDLAGDPITDNTGLIVAAVSYWPFSC